MRNENFAGWTCGALRGDERPGCRVCRSGALLAVLLLSVAAALAAEPAHEFTVATYNVLFQNRDLPALAATLRGTGADLVALQETTPAAEQFLRRELGALYPHMVFRNGTKGSDGLGFLSKVPLERFSYIEPLAGWRGTWIAEVCVGQTNVQVANVHLATPQVNAMRSLATIMSGFQEAETLHAREIARIYERLSPGLTNQPTLVLGDFNSFSFFTAPAFLASHGFVDSFASVTTNADQHGTWEVRRGDTRWQFRLDYIFHTPDLATVESRILSSAASDHQPVVSRLRRREGPAH